MAMSTAGCSCMHDINACERRHAGLSSGSKGRFCRVSPMCGEHRAAPAQLEALGTDLAPALFPHTHGPVL
eukprot:1335125-Pleurochrysis_carterae.AAC.4